MKVKLAVQCIASHSVASALRWCYENVPGFKEDDDVLCTADCIDLMDKIFDILNSRNPLAKGYKRCLTTDPQCVSRIEEVFVLCKAVLQSLTQCDSKPLLEAARKTGPLGILCAIQVVRSLLTDMAEKRLPMKYLLTYKLSQDQIELFFGAVRLRNGCTFNPNSTAISYCLQKTFDSCWRQHPPTNENCESRDNTSGFSIRLHCLNPKFFSCL